MLVKTKPDGKVTIPLNEILPPSYQRINEELILDCIFEDTNTFRLKAVCSEREMKKILEE